MADGNQNLEDIGSSNQAANAEEVAAASSQWEQERVKGTLEVYAVDRSMTPLQSRLESLATKGVKLTPASQSQIQGIVRAAHEQRAKAKRASAELAAKEEARLKQKAQAEKTSKDNTEKEKKKSKAEAKRQAFLKKLSSGSLKS